MTESHETPVVAPVKMPKLKTDAKTLAGMNAWSIALACFFGFAGIFAAIAGFTVKAKWPWSFEMPAITGLLGSNTVGTVSIVLLGTLFALVMGLIGIITVGKVTDGEALKKNWGCIARTLFFITLIYVVDIVALILYSLISIGISKGTKIQKSIWLNSFLPTFIMALGTCGLAFLAKTIAGGKLANARIASFIGIALGAISFVLSFIAIMVTLYGD